MPDPTPAERAACCGPICGRSTDATGPCIAATYGRAHLRRLEAAGYVVEQGWQPSETAPRETVLLVWGNGPVRLGICDALGNWRARHNGPFKSPPSVWRHPPAAPAQPRRQIADA